jgi:hypothetical protein
LACKNNECIIHFVWSNRSYYDVKTHLWHERVCYDWLPILFLALDKCCLYTLL